MSDRTEGSPPETALQNLARQLFARGLVKESQKVLGLCKSTSSAAVELELRFHNALNRTDWIAAERNLARMKNSLDQRLLTLHLNIVKGDSKRAEILVEELASEIPADDPIAKVRYLIYKAEWFCLRSGFPNAVQPLLTALDSCNRHYLRSLEVIVKLHLAHVLLQMDMASDALRLCRPVLGLIIAQHEAFEVGRARCLMAKCLVAASARDNVGVDERRADCLTAINELKKAAKVFRSVEAHYRVKDVLYMQARLYHSLDMVKERNQVSAEFKKMEEQYQTNVTCRLAIML